MHASSSRRARTPRLLSAIVLILTLAGCAMLRRPEPVVDRSQDPRIQRDVASRLAAEPAIDATRIRVEVDAAIVILYGSVPGIVGWNCAIRNSQMVPGVLSVVDYLVIERGDREIRCLVPPPAALAPTT